MSQNHGIPLSERVVPENDDEEKKQSADEIEQLGEAFGKTEQQNVDLLNSSCQKSRGTSMKQQESKLKNVTQYGDCDQNRFLSTLGLTNFFMEGISMKIIINIHYMTYTYIHMTYMTCASVHIIYTYIYSCL